MESSGAISAYGFLWMQEFQYKFDLFNSHSAIEIFFFLFQFW